MVKPGVDVAAKIPIKVETKKSDEKSEPVEVGKEAVEVGECSGTKEEEPIFNEEWSEVILVERSKFMHHFSGERWKVAYKIVLFPLRR